MTGAQRYAPRWRHLLASVGLAWLTVLLVATPVLAHAALLTSTVRDGDRFADAPDHVTLTFSEPVGLPRDAVRLYDATASVVAPVDARTAGSEVRITLPALLDGAYVLTVRVISRDGHVITQPFRFVVGPNDTLDEATFDGVVDDVNRDPTRWVMVVLRALTYVTTVLALGFLAFTPRLVDGQQLQQLARRWAGRLAIGGALAALLSALITGWWVYAPLTLTSWVNAMTETATSGFVLRVVTLGLFGLGLWVHRLRLVSLAAAPLLMAAHVLDGHQLTFGVRWVMLLADTVHLAAASLWFGGAVLLWWLWRHDKTGMTRASLQFTRVAFWVAGATVASGVVMAQQLLDGPNDLFTSNYGNVLGAKLVGVGAVGVLALRLKRLLAVEPIDLARLRRRLSQDVGAFIAVLSLTAVLVTTSPQADSADTLLTQRSAFGPYTLDIAIEPGVRGTNVLHAYVITAEGTLAKTGDDLTLSATYVAPDGERIGPFDTPLAWVSDGHFLAVTDVFQFAGTWELTFHAPIDRFRVVTETLVVSLS